MYADLQELLDAQDVVLYESVTPPGTGGVPAGADDAERVAGTRAALRFLAAVLAVHWEQRGSYPESLDALAAFGSRLDPRIAQWVATAQVDGWGREVSYRRAGGGGFVLESLGADGRPGGDGAAADLELTSEDDVGTLGLAGEEDNLQAELAKALGLRFQLDAIDYDRANFRGSDMAMDQLERALAERGIDFGEIGSSLAGTSLPARLAIMMLRLIRFADEFIFEGTIADGCKVVLIEMFNDDVMLEQAIAQMGPGFADVIIGQRNQVAVDDLKALLAEEPEVGSVAILYGAAHMPDLAERLADQLGYRPAGEQWYTAFKVDLADSALTERQLRTLRSMVRQQMGELKKRRD
jgi:hypothetical protein